MTNTNIVTVTPPFRGIRTRGGAFVEGPNTREYLSVKFDEVEHPYDNFGFEPSNLERYRHDFGSVLSAMRTSDAMRKAVSEVRSARCRNEMNFLKATRLHSIFFGTFATSRPEGKRTYVIEDSGLQQHAGLVCVDFDKLYGDYDRVKRALMDDEYVHACFRSPSGNGIKAVVKVPPLDANTNHRAYYASVLMYWRARLVGIGVDVACENPSRRCFASFDEDAYVNVDSWTWTEKFEEASIEYVPVTDVKVRVQDWNRSFQAAIKRIEDGTRKGGNRDPLHFVSGEMHRYIITLAGMCKGFGMPEDVFFNLASSYMVDEHAVRVSKQIYNKR